MSFSFTADDEHCICVRNIQLKLFISVHYQLKGFIPILNCFTFKMSDISQEWQLRVAYHLFLLLLLGYQCVPFSASTTPKNAWAWKRQSLKSILVYGTWLKKSLLKKNVSDHPSYIKS